MSDVAIKNSRLPKRPSAIWSLCWKQSLEFVPAVIALTICSLVIYLIVSAIEPECLGDHQFVVSILTMTTIAFSFAACFIAFVSENESRTRSFLMNLPLSSSYVGAVKVLMIVLAVVVFFAVQLALGGVWIVIGIELNSIHETYQNEMIEKIPAALLMSGSIVGVAIVISLFACSFWSQSWASVLTALAFAIYTPFALVWLWPTLFGVQTNVEPLSGIRAWLVEGPLLLAAIGAIWFPLRWLRRHPWQIGRYAAALAERPQTEAPSRPKEQLMQRPLGGKFGSLIWQSLHQQYVFPILIFFMLIVFLLYRYAEYLEFYRGTGARRVSRDDDSDSRYRGLGLWLGDLASRQNRQQS